MRRTVPLYIHQLAPGMKLENGEELLRVESLGGRSIYIETAVRSATLVAHGRLHVLAEVAA